MLETYQQTINDLITFKGNGLHTGRNCNLTIKPAKENQGIVFKRTDLAQNNLIKANYKYVTSAKLCTTLENENGVKVSTVEHLLAALYIAGIDNAIVEIDNQEIPIMDGSAKDFLSVLQKIQKRKLNKKRKYLKIIKNVKLINEEKNISIHENNNDFEVDFKLNYKNKIIGRQRNLVNFNSDDLSEVIESRTFCLYEDIEKIKKNGLAKGGSLDNAIVVDGENILNKGGLRNQKEFVNHKILDLAGDFLLSGYRVLGKVVCNQGGHELSNLFLKKLFNSKSSFSIVEKDDLVISKKVGSVQAMRIAVNA
tara:strand:- start:1548 stop:2474 length:927 start_codon:yes stop_codon:yes gene_type:complete